MSTENANTEVRREQENDHAKIGELITLAFKGKAYSDGTEAAVVDRLREAGDLTLSLVAIDGEALVGQVAFSPAGISTGVGSWYALGPIAVEPGRQGCGIGGKLIDEGFAQLREMKADGCILIGDPAYYSRHGFNVASEHCPEGEPAEYFQLISFGNIEPVGSFSFHSAFYG